MKILVTNDDGIYSEGIKILVEFAKKYGEVIVVAPKIEQSAKSHALDIKGAIECKKVDLFEGVDAYMVDSTPADCVRYAYYGLKEDFNLVLSGINRGYNLGNDILYSGTVAAAAEAALHFIKAIAFSTHHKSFEGAISQFERVFKHIIDNEMLEEWNLYNVNFPLFCDDSTEILLTAQGGTNFQTTFDLNGNDYYQKGVPCFENSKDKLNLDTSAIMNGYISITPLVYDRTNYYVLNNLKNKKNK